MLQRNNNYRPQILGLFIITYLFLLIPFNAEASEAITFKDASNRIMGSYSGSHALLIGVSDYTAGWPSLRNIPSELKPVAGVLKAQGFTVEKVISPDATQLKESIENFIDRYGFDANNRLLFYFSGHGWTRKHGSKGYLVPSDAPDPHKNEKGFLRKALNMNQILAWSREIEAKHVLFLFDSCFSGTIFKSRALPDIPPQISAMTARPVRQFITAGSAGEQVPAVSVFTPAFVDGIKYGTADLNKDGYISGTELGLYLQSEVPQHAHETPQYGKISDYALSRGDFILLAGSSVEKSLPQAGKRKVKLQVRTRPSGAMVYANGMQQGSAPLTLTKFKGQVVISAKKAGYADASERIRIRPGKSQQITLSLNRVLSTGSIRILSNPDGAKWYLDGNYMGTTPDTATEIKPGSHRIKVVQSGLNDWQQSVRVSKGNTSELVATLNKPVLTHALTINATPADARIRILNIGPKYTPGMQLKSGNYHVEVSKPGYRKHRAWIELGNSDLSESISLSITVAAIKMVSIPSGSFEMGSNNGESEEKPVHRVHVNSFKMGKYEVTQAQWRSVMGSNPSKFKGDDNPVEQVSWDDIQQFIRKLNNQMGSRFRLPSESEWEYAARAGSTTKYSWGEKIGSNRANCNGCGSQWDTSQTAPIGSFQPNQFGLYDMHGNVWEWVQDIYHYGYKTSPNDGDVSAPNDGSVWNGDDFLGGLRVMRGGSWNFKPGMMRSARRLGFYPDRSSFSTGFRLAHD